VVVKFPLPQKVGHKHLGLGLCSNNEFIMFVLFLCYSTSNL
jgi:hypothetical protein